MRQFAARKPPRNGCRDIFSVSVIQAQIGLFEMEL